MNVLNPMYKQITLWHCQAWTFTLIFSGPTFLRGKSGKIKVFNLINQYVGYWQTHYQQSVWFNSSSLIWLYMVWPDLSVPILKSVSTYRIYSAIRRGFPSLEWVQIIKSVLCNFAVIRVLPFLNNPKDLDQSFKTDLDFWGCFGRKKHPLISEEIWYLFCHREGYSKGSLQTVYKPLQHNSQPATNIRDWYWKGNLLPYNQIYKILKVIKKRFSNKSCECIVGTHLPSCNLR